MHANTRWPDKLISRCHNKTVHALPVVTAYLPVRLLSLLNKKTCHFSLHTVLAEAYNAVRQNSDQSTIKQPI